MTGLLRAELRKTFSTRLWWAVLVPALLLSVLINLFGGVFTDAVAAVPGNAAAVPLLLASLAYALALTGVFALVTGVVSTAGEFRHRTVTTTYLTASGRGRVLLAKMAAAGFVGALYGAACVLVGVLSGLAGRAGSAFPDAGPLLAVSGIGMLVTALWAAFGAALGMVVTHQVGALVGALVYLLFGELLISALLNGADSAAVNRITAFLPGNAGDVALYDIPAREIAGPGPAAGIVEVLAGVTGPPAWWAALLVLTAWTVTVAAAGWVVGGRRDVT